MSNVEVAVALVIVFAFALGITIGVVLIVSFASRREDRLGSIWGEAPDPACGGARRLIGAGVRGGPPASEFHDYGEDAGQEPER